MQIGDRTVSLVTVEEYTGWERFKSEIVHLLETLQRTGLVNEPERFSFRYRNLLAKTGFRNELDLLNARFEILGKPVEEPGFQLRFERREPEATTITQIHTGAVATKSSTQSRTGLLLDLDTVWNATTDFWNSKDRLLERGHSTVKEAFFAC